MNSTLSDLSTSLSALAAAATAKLFHVPSQAGGRSALSFDGKRLLVPAIEAAKGEEVFVLAPGGAPVATRVAGFDPALGLAVLVLDEALPATAWTPSPAMPALASLVLSVAYPSEDGPEARLGVVRIAHGEAMGEDAYIQVDGASFPGFSGGAIVGADASIAGVLAADRNGNRGWALSALRARALVEEIVAKGFPSKAWLGISSLPVDLPESLRAAAKGADEALMVASLSEKGPAANAGVLPGDIILSVGGVEVRSSEALRKAIEALEVETPVTIAILRGGLPVEIAMKTSGRPGEGEEGSRGGWGQHGHASHHGHAGHHGHHNADGDCGHGGEGCGCSADR